MIDGHGLLVVRGPQCKQACRMRAWLWWGYMRFLLTSHRVRGACLLMLGALFVVHTLWLPLQVFMYSVCLCVTCPLLLACPCLS